MKPRIEAKQVTKDFLQGDEVVHALRETSFSVNEGEFVAIIGPSGSGKSTLLTILGGLQAPTTGRVFIDGVPFSDLARKRRNEVRFEKIGFILQAANLISFLKVGEQISLYSRIKRERVNQERIHELFSRLGIEKLKNKYPSSLSGGEKQRIAIAKALYHNPSVILADEPTAALDTRRALEVVQLLSQETKEEKKATIMVTHDERLTAFCDKVYVIVDGVMKERTTEIA